MRSTIGPSAVAAVFAAASLVAAQFSIDSDDAIKKTAATIAADMITYYHGNEPGQTPGILPGPPPVDNPKAGYYWWEAGAMWGTLMDYWLWTGDSKYNNLIMQAMQFQVGEGKDYMPRNVTASLGNDDQAFWGMSAMQAAENNFPNPASDKPQWLALAQAVWNTQAAPDRHDNTCGGGLRWQIPLSNNGYGYKNSIANGCFFNMGARLARYTGDKKYADWAEKTWDWMEKVQYINPQTGAIYDGANVKNDCKDINRAEYSYNNGVFALGAAYMFNYTDGSAVWQQRVEQLVDYGLKTFFPGGIAVELSCENNKAAGTDPDGSCTNDMLCFKGFMHRWYSTMTQIAPFTAAKILPVLKTSAEAAVKQCTGGDNGRACGFKWASGTYNGQTGAGQEMSVLAASSALLIGKAKAPVTSKSGGTSKGDPNAGQNSDDFLKHVKPATTGDKAGAGIITFLILGSACGMFSWMSMGA